MPRSLAARGDCSGLILLDGVIGDRAFTENAAAQVIKPMSTSLELRFGGFEEYLTRWRAQQGPYSDEAERVLERTIRYELAPLPDGTYRRRALRAAFEETWASLLQVRQSGRATEGALPNADRAGNTALDRRPAVSDGRDHRRPAEGCPACAAVRRAPVRLTPCWSVIPNPRWSRP